MPQWAGSCWYYLRYIDPDNKDVLIDSKKEALRIKKNKLSKQDINSNPSPAIDINSGKPLLIK